MTYKITAIPGDGIGPEIMAAAMRVINATGVNIEWEIVHAGADVMEKYGTPLPDYVLESIRRNKIALKGPITTPIGTGFRSVNVALRQELDLYACVRPAKLYSGVNSRYTDVDLYVVRENTEDLYAGVEFDAGTFEAKSIMAMANGKIQEDAAISIKSISVTATRRIVKYAFDLALRLGRKKVTAVSKANIMKFTDGLFYRVAREVAQEYEGKVAYDEILVDALCMELVQRPQNFDVLVMPNLYGDIVSDLCAGLIGGLGVAPGANIGEEYAIFEPVHGSAPKLKGLNQANPTALILSGVLMLRHIGEFDAADRLERAVAQVLAEGKAVTADLCPPEQADRAVGTDQMADAIIAALGV